MLVGLLVVGRLRKRKEAGLENLVSHLLREYEGGQLSRRRLIQTLATLVVGGQQPTVAGLRVTRFDHLAVNVTDLRRSQDFYTSVFAASVNGNPRPRNEVRLDLNAQTSLVLRQADIPGRVDHVAVRVEGFDRAELTRNLRARGIAAVGENDVPGTPGFHIVDPDGFKVQLE